jgi:hypothetical protein
MKFFKNKNKNHPIEGYSYAVTTGTYVGEMLVFVEENKDNFEFISIPKNKNRQVPKDKFKLGIEEKIVDVVEKLPNNIYNLLKKQFDFNRRNHK